MNQPPETFYICPYTNLVVQFWPLNKTYHQTNSFKGQDSSGVKKKKTFLLNKISAYYYCYSLG